MNKTKVLHIGCGHRPNDNRILLRECRSLQKAGYDVTYATSKEWTDSPEELDTVVDGVKVKAGNWKLGGVFLTRDALKFVKCRSYNKKEIIGFILNERPDILHVHELELMYVVPVIRKRMPDIRVIFDVHEDLPGSYHDLFTVYTNKLFASIASEYIKLRLKKYLAVSDAVITVTPFLQNELEQYGAKKVYQVRNFPILRDPVPDVKKNPWICYCGTIDEGRNISMMLRIADRLDGQLQLAGQCGGEAQKLISECEQKLPDKVKYQGVVDHERVLEICSSSKVGLCLLKRLKNYTNSYATKIFEYMMEGIPVVCSNFPAWKEIVEDNECGIMVDPEDEEGIIEAVNRLLKDEPTADRMGQNARRAIEEKYNWETESETLLLVYKNIFK